MTATQDASDTTSAQESSSDSGTAPTTHQGILDFVNEVAAMTKPDRIHWCTGSDEEWTELTDALVSTGTFTQLNPAIKPNSFYAASDPTDVARVEDRTFICSVDEKDCGPTNNWMDAGRDEGPHARALRRLHGRPHDVRHPVRDGPPRGREADVRHRDHRLGLRHRLDARDGPHGHPRARADGRARRRLRAGPALRRPPARPRARRTSRGRATTPSTSCSSPRSARSGPTAPATAATRCSARSATRCASPA